jgi:Pvc16 N-terminal domain
VALADSSRAIGAVTGLLSERLENLTTHNVTVGRPEPPSANGGIVNPRLNLFLYEAVFDPHLRNTPLDAGQEPPLWLVLRYLVTPFDDVGESDTADAFRILGDGLRALQALTHVPITGLSPDDQTALDPNPELLRVTFNEASADLLAKLMQGSDEKYRFSMTFEVRPVMIAAVAPPSYGLLVGVDYSAPPPNLRDDNGLGLSVEPMLGPIVELVDPPAFTPGDPPVRVIGQDLGLEGLEVELGPVVLPLAAAPDGTPTFDPTADALAGDAISAGSHGLTLARTLPSGRRRRSNLVVVSLLPELNDVNHVAPDPGVPDDVAQLELDGQLLGRDEDDVVVALYRDGTTVRAYDQVVDAPGDPPPQTLRRVPLAGDPLDTGDYRVVLRVNGQQARQSPEVPIP